MRSGCINRRRCRCDMQLAALTRDRRTLRWALRCVERGREGLGGKKVHDQGEQEGSMGGPQLRHGDGDLRMDWSGVESVFELLF